jgi:hypothetical protein
MDHSKKKSGSRETTKKRPPLGLIIVLSVAIGAVIGSAVTSSLSKSQPAPKQTNASPTASQMPQPFNMPPPQQQFTPAPQPPGEVPPGKVWSVEHGHWHDIPAALTTPVPTIETPAPASAPVEKKE